MRAGFFVTVSESGRPADRWSIGSFSDRLVGTRFTEVRAEQRGRDEHTGS